MDARNARLTWTEGWREIWERVRTLWAVKMSGMMGGMAVFFAVYFQVLNHPIFPVTVMPFTKVDAWIAFRPEALPLYASLWFYVSLLPALLKSREALVRYGWRALGLSVAGLAIFVVWPTVLPKREIEGMEHAAFAWLMEIDATGNACPSLHVAFAVFTAIGLGRLAREIGLGGAGRGANWLWCAGIVYSTLAIQQHVVIDVVAGAALGAVATVGGRFQAASCAGVGTTHR